MEDAGVVVDYVQWLDLRIPIIHLYTYKNKSTSCRSFIPLEDTQPPVDIDQPRLTMPTTSSWEVTPCSTLAAPPSSAGWATRKLTSQAWAHRCPPWSAPTSSGSWLGGARRFRQLTGGQPTRTQTSTLPTSSWSPQATSPTRPYSLAWYVEWSFLVRVLKWRNDGAPQDVPPETWGVVGANRRFFDGCVF